MPEGIHNRGRGSVGGGLDSAGVGIGVVKPEREGCTQQGTGELPLWLFFSPPEAAVPVLCFRTRTMLNEQPSPRVMIISILQPGPFVDIP